MSRHCSHMGRPCPARPECAPQQCEAAKAFPIGNEEAALEYVHRRADAVSRVEEHISAGVTGNDAELVAAVRTLRRMGYTFKGGQEWEPPLAGVSRWRGGSVKNHAGWLAPPWPVPKVTRLETGPVEAPPYRLNVTSIVRPNFADVNTGFHRAWTLAMNRPDLGEQGYDEAAFVHVNCWLKRREALDLQLEAGE